MDHPFQSPAILSFCPGFLGLERGLERAIGPLRVAAYVEIEAFICANLVAGMEAGVLAPTPIWTNVKTFEPQPFRGKIHGIIGGYPCQPFSNAGSRRGKEDPRHLWPYIYEALRAIRPVWCFFENVSGHLSLGYDSVYKDLRDLGYAVEAGIYTAEETGAPHERERLFILALDHSRCHGFKPKYSISAGRNGAEPTGENLANAARFGRNGSRSRSKGGRGKLANSGEELANPGSAERRSDNPDGFRPNEIHIREGRQEAAGSPQRGEAVVNSESSGKRGDAGNISETNGGQIEGVRFESGSSGEQVAHPVGPGFENKRIDRKQNEADDHRTFSPSNEQSLAAAVGLADSGSEGLERFGLRDGGAGAKIAMPAGGRGHQWPAGPGQPQYEWEEPRTAEPGVGCTINGYNFREDLLRAFGNMVVEQTAEIAFPDLLNKHMTNETSKRISR